jgi:hypothetical protein
VSGGIYLLRGEGDLVEMREQAYDSEALLQGLLAQYPSLLAGDQLASVPRRWLLIKREASLAADADGGGRWSVDHLFVDQDAVPTLIEVKRSSNTQIRREVVGQMLDYAANAVVYWPVERLRAYFEAACDADGADPADRIAERLGVELDQEAFWQSVETNLRAGRVRLVFVADDIPAELRRVIEFLNEQMDPAEVIGIEVKQYVGEDLRTLVPRVIGQTAFAEGGKSGGRALTTDWDWSAYASSLSEDKISLAHALDSAIEAAARERALPWQRVFRRGYIAFQRPGEYNVVVIELWRERPLRLAIKLPLPLLDLGEADPYPTLESAWDAQNKQWNWVIPSLDLIPDVGPAVELTAKYQPASGPMIQAVAASDERPAG